MKIITIITLFYLSKSLFAGIGVGTSAPGALPVELNSFSAIIKDNSILLYWTTETEVNNYGFYIERASLTSPDIIWETVGFIKGSGNSNSPKEYSFLDTPNGGTQFQYRLRQIDNDGKYRVSDILNVDLNKLIQFNLNQNFPNPFNPSTVISYSLPVSSEVTLSVYNMLGELIATLVNSYQEAGFYSINFNATGISTGVYFYKMQAQNFIMTNKMLFLK